MRDILWLNARPLSDFGAHCIDHTGLDEPVMALPSRIALADAGGWIPSAQRALGGGLVTITVRFAFCRTFAELFASIEAMAAALTGEIELWYVHRPRQQLRLFLVEVPAVSARGPVEHVISRDLKLTFSRMDPGWIDRQPIVRALGVAPVAVPVGRLASAPRVTVYPASGTLTAPVIHVASPTGQAVASCALTGSLSATQWAELEAATGDTRVTSAGVTAFDQARLAIDAELPALPGARVGAADPQVWLSASAGTPAGLLIAWRVF